MPTKTHAGRNKTLQKLTWKTATAKISRALRPSPEQPIDKKIGFLPYILKITDHIGRILKKHNKLTREILEHLNSINDKRDPKTSSRVYRVPCSSNQVYIGTTKCSTNTSRAEENSAIDHGHQAWTTEIIIISKKKG